MALNATKPNQLAPGRQGSGVTAPNNGQSLARLQAPVIQSTSRRFSSG
jgi:hypothetical protein